MKLRNQFVLVSATLLALSLMAGSADAAIILTNTGASTVFNGSTSPGTISGDKGGTISNWALNGGNAVVFLISQEDSTNWSGFTASYGAEAMTVVETIGVSTARWNSAIAYIINPVASTANITFGWTGGGANNSEGVYTPLSLSNVASVLGSTSGDSASNLPTLTLPYTSTVDGGFVVGAGNNNNFSGGADTTPGYDGDLDSILFRNNASGNTGVTQVYGDIPTAGSSQSRIGDVLGAASASANSAAIVAFEAVPVPEPGSLALMGLGGLMLFGLWRRKR